MRLFKNLPLVVLLTLTATALAQVELDRQVIASGGGTAASAGHTLSFTMGQPVIGVVSSDLYQLDIGFWVPGLGNPTPVIDLDLPTVMSLGQNYPNPFNPITRIGFALPETAPVSLAVYNLRGQRVRLLLDEVREAGRHEVSWDGTDDQGRGVSSGTYVARIVSSAGIQNRKMLLAR